MRGLPWRYRHPILNAVLQWAALFAIAYMVRVVVPADATGVLVPIRWLAAGLEGLSLVAVTLVMFMASLRSWQAWKRLSS